MTENACRFVCPKSFESVCRQAVYTSLWASNEEFSSNHTSFIEWVDIIVIAPATADVIAKLAAGICADLLTTTLCACWEKPILLAPSMNDKMWSNPVVQRNVDTIQGNGMKIAGPASGHLACGTEGTGRMLEPEEIIDEIIKMLTQENSR
jgi:phosphopantothenoylcysteine decarboxylase/phosphopantothenate--cysteine ligase